MFSYKSKKKLKEEIENLENQVEYVTELVKIERKEKMELKDRKDDAEHKYFEEIKKREHETRKLKEQMIYTERERKENIELRATLERRDGVIRILEKDVEVLEEKLGKYMEQEAVNKYLKNELEKLRHDYNNVKKTIWWHEEDKELWKINYCNASEEACRTRKELIRANKKIRQLREERRRNQELHEELVKKLKKQKNRTLEDEIGKLQGNNEFLYKLSDERLKKILLLREENKQLKEQNKKLNDAIFTVKNDKTKKAWTNIAYVME